MAIEPMGSGPPDNRLFFTNAVLCMKGLKGPRMQGDVDRDRFRSCEPFLKRTIDLVAPKVVITLGREAQRSVWRAYLKAPLPPLALAAGKLHTLTPIMQLLPVYHPGRRNLNRYRPLPLMKVDWQPLAQFIDR